MNEGWKCPLCGKVYAPSVTECGACNGVVKIDHPNPNSPTVAPYSPYTIPNTFPAEPQKEWGPYCIATKFGNWIKVESPEREYYV